MFLQKGHLWPVARVQPLADKRGLESTWRGVFQLELSAFDVLLRLLPQEISPVFRKNPSSCLRMFFFLLPVGFIIGNLSLLDIFSFFILSRGLKQMEESDWQRPRSGLRFNPPFLAGAIGRECGNEPYEPFLMVSFEGIPGFIPNTRKVIPYRTSKLCLFWVSVLLAGLPQRSRTIAFTVLCMFPTKHHLFVVPSPLSLDPL